MLRTRTWVSLEVARLRLSRGLAVADGVVETARLVEIEVVDLVVEEGREEAMIGPEVDVADGIDHKIRHVFGLRRL